MSWYDELLGRAAAKSVMVTAEDALPGRSHRCPFRRRTSSRSPAAPPFPEGMQTAVFGMGCFWGAEKEFWHSTASYTTAVGYAGGYTPNPTYEETCSGRTGHTEVVLVVFDPKVISYADAAQGVLGEPRPHTGHAAGQRPGHPVPFGDLHDRRAAAESGRGHRGGLPEEARRRGTGRSPPRSPRWRSSTTPRTTTSSTSPRTPAVTAPARHRRQLPGRSAEAGRGPGADRHPAALVVPPGLNRGSPTT